MSRPTPPFLLALLLAAACRDPASASGDASTGDVDSEFFGDCEEPYDLDAVYMVAMPAKSHALTMLWDVERPEAPCLFYDRAVDTGGSEARRDVAIRLEDGALLFSDESRGDVRLYRMATDGVEIREDRWWPGDGQDDELLLELSPKASGLLPWPATGEMYAFGDGIYKTDPEMTLVNYRLPSQFFDAFDEGRKRTARRDGTVLVTGNATDGAFVIEFIAPYPGNIYPEPEVTFIEPPTAGAWIAEMREIDGVTVVVVAQPVDPADTSGLGDVVYQRWRLDGITLTQEGDFAFQPGPPATWALLDGLGRLVLQRVTSDEMPRRIVQRANSQTVEVLFDRAYIDEEFDLPSTGDDVMLDRVLSGHTSLRTR